ncbi:hypothetical protein AB0I02_27275 [Streptomyces phaeochromogenes]
MTDSDLPSGDEVDVVMAFATERLTTTIEALTHASATAIAAETQTPGRPKPARQSRTANADELPAATRKKESPLDAQQIRKITESLGDITHRIHAADTEKKGPLHEALGITISYEHTTRTATVRSRPSSAYRQRLCPRGGFDH